MAANIPDRTSRREILVAGLSFALLAAGFLAPVVLQGKLLLPLDLVMGTEPWRSELGRVSSPLANPLISDVVWEAYPMAVQAVEGWRRGEVLWDSTAMTGSPGWAAGKMYSNPVFLALALVLSPARAMSWAAVVHLFLGSFFCYLLLRELRAGPAAAAVGGLAFGFNGYLVGWLSLTYCVGTMAWTPVVAWGIERSLRRRDVRWLAVSAIAFALQVFAGYILFALYSALALGVVYGLRGLLAGWRARSITAAARPVASAAGALVVGACLAAVLLVPSLELYGESNRSYKSGANSFLRIDDSVRLAAPGISGSPVGGGEYRGPFNYSETDLYFGIVPLIAMVAALRSSRRRVAAVFFAVGLVPYLAVLSVPPFRQLVTLLVPVFTSTFPGRIFFVVAFCWAVVAGLGVEAALAERSARRWAVAAALTLAAACAVCWAGLTWAPTYKFPRPHWLLWGVGFALATAALFPLVTRVRSGPRWVGAGLVALLALDLGIVGFSYNPAFPGDMLYPETPSIAALRRLQAAEPEGARIVTVVSSSILTGMSGGVYGLERLSGYTSWVLQRYSRYMRLTGDGKSGGNQVGFHGCCGGLLDAAAPALVFTAAHTPLPDEPRAGDLRARLSSARVQSLDAPATTSWTIGGEERAVLYQHPPSRIEFPLEIPDRGSFRAALAVDPRAWETGGDGVRFEVRALCGEGGEVNLLSRYLDPASTPTDRAWVPVAATLPGADRCPELEGVALLTWPGPEGNRYFDWAGWGEPWVEGASARLEVVEEGENRILRNARALPRARLVHRVVEHPPEDLDGVEEILRGADFDPATTAVVEGRLPGAPGAASPADAVRLLAAAPTRVELEVETDAPALLVLSDAYYPGWRATVDGAETPVYATNLAFRGVFVPAGRHRVVFELRPGSLRLGAGLSLGALAVVAGIWIAGRPRTGDSP